MEDNSETIRTPLLDTENAQPAQLYLSTCEILARYAYQAIARQQQLNILAQQVTVNNARNLYTIINQ